jgi:MFS family permease
MTRNPAPFVHRIQGISSVTDGAVLTTVVLYFSHVVGISGGSVGLVLAASAMTSLALAAPLGRAADRIGLRNAAVIYSLALAAALGAYTVAHTLWAYAAAAIAFGVARSGIASTIQAIVARATAPELRVSARARLHTLLNAGFGIGSVIGAAVLAVGRPAFFVALYALSAVASAACAGMFSKLGVTRAPSTERCRTCRSAMRDRRLLTVAGLTAVLLLTIPILSVLLPLWLTSRTAAPTWVAAGAFGLNTVFVFLLQSPWSARIRTDADASRSALVAGSALAVACLLFALMPFGGTIRAATLALVGVAVLTLGEVAAGPAAWHLALRDTPARQQGEYQAVFGMSYSVARILGPLVALPLITGLGPAGWVVVAAAMLSASFGLAVIGPARSVLRPAAAAA